MMQTMPNMMHGGMQSMMSGVAGWFMMGTYVVGLAVLILAGAALIKYLFFSQRIAS